jgi:hypothetical protein
MPAHWILILRPVDPRRWASVLCCVLSFTHLAPINMSRFRLPIILGGFALIASACDTSPSAPGASSSYYPYVAVGGSVAAGVQSWGFSAQTQEQAYPELLASYLQIDLGLRRVDGAGCPEPVEAPLEMPREPLPCSLAGSQPSDSRGQNVAVPYTRVTDAITVPSADWIPHHAVLLGERSQIALMGAVRPRFVTVHLGDHDVWDAALSGTLGPAAVGGDSLLTRISVFESAYSAVVAALNSLPDLEHAALIGITDPVVFLPHLQRGATSTWHATQGGSTAERL